MKARPVIHQWRLEIAHSDLSAVQRAIAWAMSLYGNENGEEIKPSIQSIAQAAGCHRRTVEDNLPILEEKGWIYKVFCGQKSRNPSAYRVMFPNKDLHTAAPSYRDREANTTSGSTNTTSASANTTSGLVQSSIPSKPSTSSPLYEGKMDGYAV